MQGGHEWREEVKAHQGKLNGEDAVDTHVVIGSYVCGVQDPR